MQELLAPFLGPEGPLQESVYFKLNQYLATLLDWNSRMNLTGIREPEEIVCRHFGESFFAARYISKCLKTMLDYGSGAGFPGLPVQIIRPEIAVTLAESNGKKATFLREMTRIFSLDTVVHEGRVENLEVSARFDVVALRAVERMAKALPKAAGRVELGGILLVMTTMKNINELSSAVRGFSWREPVIIPESEARVILVGQRTR